jgi:co-chaperonin GroES (HSP10)
LADYKTLPKLTDLDPGIRVYGFNILVLPRELEEKTKGGLILTESIREREDEAGIEGMIVAAGQFAFNFEDATGVVTPWEDRPQTGDVVMFARYAGGRNFTGTDGRKYRIMQDKDILGARIVVKAKEPA